MFVTKSHWQVGEIRSCMCEHKCLHYSPRNLPCQHPSPKSRWDTCLSRADSRLEWIHSQRVCVSTTCDLPSWRWFNQLLHILKHTPGVRYIRKKWHRQSSARHLPRIFPSLLSQAFIWPVHAAAGHRSKNAAVFFAQWGLLCTVCSCFVLFFAFHWYCRYVKIHEV